MATLLQNRANVQLRSSSPVLAHPPTLRSVHVGSLVHQQQHRRVNTQQQLGQASLPPIGYGLAQLGGPLGLRQKTIMHSFLGVGAPEAILVAVVALVVFGPKGLADAAKSLGQTLRAFQPTIREVVEVSQEIKGTLEQELGLDELKSAASMRPTPRPARPMGSDGSDDSAAATAAGSSSDGSSSSSNLKPVSEDQARQLDPDIELKRAMSEQAAWGGQAPAASTGGLSAAAAAVAAAPAAAGSSAAEAAAPAAKDLSQLSLEELEAELARRKKTA